MEFYNDDDSGDSSRREPKPYLPDIHLKSALTSDVINELGRLITGQLKQPIDKALNPYASLFSSKLREISRIKGVELNLAYGEKSVHFINCLWSLKQIQIDKHIRDLLEDNLKIFYTYLDTSRDYVKNLTKGLLTRDDKESLIDKLILGQKKEDVANMISMGPNFYTSYQNFLRERLNNHDNLESPTLCDPRTGEFSSTLRLTFNKMDRSMILRNKMMKLQRVRKKAIHNFCLFVDGDTLYTDQFASIMIDENTVLFLSYDQILLITDTISSRFLTLLFLSLYPQDQRSIYPTSSILIDFYNWCDDLLSMEGNEGYDILKKIEPICIAVHLRNWDPLQDAKCFLDHLMKTCSEKEREHLLNLITILNQCTNPNQLFEIFGLYRHAGHPFVDETLGCESMKDITREKIEVVEEILNQCSGACKKHFILNYIRVKKTWPLINLEKTRKHLLKISDPPIDKREVDNFVLFLNQKLININDYEISFPLHFWSTISFNKNFDYNDYIDFTPLLSDTAISPLRDNWGSLYNQRRLKTRMKIDQGYSRRTLLNLLIRRKYSNEKTKNKIIKRKIPKNWKIVCLHSKEKELKIKSRLFAMMVLEMRMYFASTEKNISDTLFKYVPNQTMTNSEAELNNKLLNLTNLKFTQNRIPITFSLDMDKFNNRWRKESTKPFFKMIDQLFGTKNLYQYSHKFFQESFFCLASYNHVPKYLERDPEFDIYTASYTSQVAREKGLNKLKKHNYESESSTTWLGQGGGCEGLRQKGWTFIISSALSATEETTGVRSYIIGQGDNQVIVVLFPKLIDNVSDADYITNYSNILSEQINNYKAVLEKFINGLGMKLKLEETWVSTTLMNYGKEILVNGCYLSGSLKRISRSYSEVNEVHPTLSTRISSIYSSCHSTSSKSFDQLVPYCMSCALSLYTFDNEVKNKGISSFIIPPNCELYQRIKLCQNPILNKQESLIFLSLNKEIGGYPVMPITEYLFRGHPDQVNTYFTHLIKGSKYIPEIKKVQVYIVENFKIARDEINYQKLIQDPTSLNWKTSNMDTGQISKILEENLRKVVVNEDILRLLNSADEKENKIVIDYLSTTSPFIPRVLNEIFRQSPEGAKLHYMSIFSDMKTMKEMMSSKDAKDLIKYIEMTENRILFYVWKLINKINNIQLDNKVETLVNWNNSFTLSEDITKYQWNKEVEGSRIPHPGQQFELCPILDQGCWICNLDIRDFNEHINYIINPDLFVSYSPGQNSLFTRGPFQPYTGSATKEKRSRSLINFPKGDRALQAAQNLFRIQDWVVSQDSSLSGFIIDLIKSRTDIPLDVIKMASGRYFGGSIIHRFQDVVTKHACRPNIRPNVYSHVYISSDNMGEYSGGKDNYYIHFQSVYLYGLSLINLINFWNPGLLASSYHLHVINYDSLKPIKEQLIGTDIIQAPKIKSLKGSVLLYSTINEYTDKCTDFDLSVQSIIDPKIDINMVDEVSKISIGTILYAYMLDQSLPLIQGSTLCNIGETIHCPLTLDDFRVFQIEGIFCQLGPIWFLDNLREILTFAHLNQLTIKSSAQILIKRLPSGLFNFLRPMMCSRVVIDQFTEFNWVPNSSQYSMNGQSLEKLIHREMCKGVLNFLNERKIWSKLVPYKSITLNRLVLLYFYSALLLGKFLHPVTIIKYLDLITREFYRLMQGESLNLKTLSDYYLSLSANDERLYNYSTLDKIKISVCGPESWIREGKIRLSETIRIKDISQNAPSTNMLSNYVYSVGKLMSSMISITPKIDLTINIHDIIEKRTTKSHDKDTDLYDYTYLIPETKQRLTHLNRLTGLYSTAQYKYAEIFLTIGKLTFQTSINLAEGAGGVSKLCSQWFNCSAIIYNSLIDLKDFVSQRAVEFIPPELEYIKNYTKIEILGIQECVRTGGNLLDEKVIKEYERLIKSKVTLPSILTMDAEISGVMPENNIKLLIINTSRLFNLLPIKSYMIIKTFFWHKDVFQSMCAYLYKNFLNLRVIKPHFSSSENTEIFLMVKKTRNFNLINYNNLILRMDDQLKNNFLSSLSSSDLLNIPFNQRLLIHRSFKEFGFKSNFSHSLSGLTDDLIDFPNFLTNPLLEISNTIDLLIYYIQYKLERSGRDLSHMRVGKLYNLIKSRNLSESLDLTNIGMIIVNLYIIKDFMISKSINYKWLDQKINIKISNESDNYYTITIDRVLWNKLYQRYFIRFLGHLDLGYIV